MSLNAFARRSSRSLERAVRSTIESLEDRRLFAAGALDTSFSADGKVLTPIGQTFDLAQAQAVQADGKILIAGSSGGNVAVTRLNANGTLDGTFGPDFDGRVLIDLGGSSDTAYDIGVDSLGRIYVSGNGAGGGTVLRLTSNGSLDAGFSGDGKANIPGSFITGLTIQSDNKVVVTGDAPGASFDMMLARFTTSGALDGTFGSGGIATRSFSATGYEVAVDVVVRPGGLAVVGTVDTTANGAGYDYALWLTNSAGTTVATRTIDASAAGKTDFANAIAVGSDGSLYLAGQSYVSNGVSNMAVVKYSSTGTLQTSFGGGDGIATVSFNASEDEGARAIAVSGSGSVLIAGDDGLGNFAVARLLSNGSLDTSFDSDGRKVISMGTGSRAVGVHRNSAGRITLAGVGSTPEGGSDFAAVRLNSSGSNDNTFGSASKVFIDFDTADDFAQDVVVGPDNKPIVVGTRLVTGNAPFGNGDFAVVRYNTNGTLDTSFSFDGRQTTDFGGDDRATAVARQSDGKIVVAGYSSTGPGGFRQFAVARYNSNGTLDTSFSGDGKQTVNFGSVDAYAWDMRLQGDGKIVIVGSVGGTSATNGFGVVRLNSNGSLDTSFSGDGKQIVNFGTSMTPVARGVTLQGDGRIVISGWAGFDAALARLNTNGTLDTSFSGDGKLTEELGNTTDYYYAVDTDSNGKIVVGGSTGFNMFVARYNANGTLDTSFDGDGKKTGVTGRILDMKVQSNNRILAAGTNQAGGGGLFRVVRFNTNGSPDTSFSGDGLVDTTMGTAGIAAANGLAFGQNGTFTVVGYAQVSPWNQDFAVARYQIA
jgi:uncharacterized delta-60 repeat protein